MVRSKNYHIIEVHYPVNEIEIFDLRKRMGSAYSKFLKNYILALPISDKEKNKLYTAVIEHFHYKRNDES